MHHPHRAAAEALDLATRDIAARRYDIAETLGCRSAPALPSLAKPRALVASASRHVVAPRGNVARGQVEGLGGGPVRMVHPCVPDAVLRAQRLVRPPQAASRLKSASSASNVRAGRRARRSAIRPRMSTRVAIVGSRY